GPRSLISTSTDLPLARLVTRARLPNGIVLRAAANFSSSKAAPLAVFLPEKPGPYHEARPMRTGRPGAGAFAMPGLAISGVLGADTIEQPCAASKSAPQRAIVVAEALMCNRAAEIEGSARAPGRRWPGTESSRFFPTGLAA